MQAGMSADAMTEPQPRHDDAQPAACPACGAAVRHDVPWCLRCYASLAATPHGEPGLAPHQQGKHRAQQEDDGDRAPAPAPAGEVDRIAEQMLAELSAGSRALPSWWSRLPASSGAKAAWVAATIAAASLALVVVMALVGQLL